MHIRRGGRCEENVRSGSALMSNKLFCEIGRNGILGLVASLALSGRANGSQIGHGWGLWRREGGGRWEMEG